MSFLSFSVFPDMGKGGGDAAQGQEGGQREEGEEGECNNRPCSRELSTCEVIALRGEVGTALCAPSNLWR